MAGARSSRLAATGGLSRSVWAQQNEKRTTEGAERGALMQRRFVMAIEVGPSVSRCAIADFEGNLLGFASSSAERSKETGAEVFRESLQAAVTAALDIAGDEVAHLDVAIAGASGIGADGQGAEALEALLAEIIPGAGRVRAVADMVAAFWGALSLPVGVVVSADVGSVCFGRNVTGETCQVGGWGPLLGDEGSAYDIARNGLRAVARAADGRARPTALSELFLRAVGARDESEMARKIYATKLHRDDIAALANQVGLAARRRDPVAMRLLEAAGRDLAISVATVLRELSLLETPTSVSFSGSVFESGRTIIEAFTRSVHEATPHARVESPLLPPIGGAFRLGLQMLGITMDEPIIHRFAKGLVSSGL